METLATVRQLIGEILGSAPPPLDRDSPLSASGVDSLGLVVLRENCEKAFGIAIPDDEWLGATSISELVASIDRSKTPARVMGASAAGFGVSSSPTETTETKEPMSESPLEWSPDDMAEPLEIGMPLMGIGNLSESPLLKYLGDLRWRHITKLTNVLSRDLVDNEGNRLYPAFFYLDIRFPAARPMGSFGENDRFMVVDTVRRFGLSMLDGVTYLVPTNNVSSVSGALTSAEAAAKLEIPTVRLSNAFVMKFDGAEWLKRSRPKSEVLDALVETVSPPDSFLASKKAQETGALDDPPSDARPLFESEMLYRYDILPDRDVNGVGLIYFANYPVFLDLAERDALKRAAPSWSESAINTRSLVRRKVVYLNNASWRDSLEIQTRSWALPGSGDSSRTRVLSQQKMLRISDGRAMCLSWAEKVFAR